MKRLFLKFLKIHRKITVIESLFNQVADIQIFTFFKRDSEARVFCEYCEIFKKAYFEENL